MTISVRVLNDDNRRGAVIRVRQVKPNGEELPGAHSHVLDSLQVVEMSVHDGAGLLVTEVQQPA